ncbi:MAG TPA: glycine--tRNA ligase subunit beta [Thermoanaerobaculia bacterium]|nr:glycine--tRNA ligase subunit beta [Thermoanaerobaculia bacterium]
MAEIEPRTEIENGELLLEVRAEEIPARMLEPATRELATRVFEELVARSLAPAEVETGFTPRRLVLVMKGLPAGEPDSEEQVMGPPVAVAYAADGSATPALAGFAKRLGLAPGDLQRVATERGEYVAAVQRKVGRPTREVLAEILPKILAALPWAKTMVWGQGYGPWVRPVHGLVALLEGEVVPFELFGITAGRTTCGHPVLSPEPFEVAGVAEYRARLAALGLEVRPAERARLLAERMKTAAVQRGGAPVSDPALLDKLAAICEIPGVIEGGFDAAFLALPREVLATSLRDHQSAFAVESEGRLLPYFLTLMDRPDDPIGRVRSGNEWVVAARLADARFFHQEDAKRSLVERAADLERLTFHVKLGSYADKGRRLVALSRFLCEELDWREEIPAAEEAAHLLKVDLTTEMVKEFTSLQGIMGGLYAREQGHPEAVWQAIYDQYTPASVEDSVPRGRAGKVVALADRFDLLAGIFGLGLIPSGSRDPFGLRRAALGAVRILLEGDLPLSLEGAFTRAVELYGEKLAQKPAEVLANLRPFVADRLRYVLGLAGYTYDEIEAGLAVGVASLPDLKARVEAVHRLREGKGFLSLVLAAKRIANILKDAPSGEVDASLLAEPAERELHEVWRRLDREVAEAATARRYAQCLERTLELGPALDRFFVEVLVMAEDPAVKANRLALLGALQATLERTARLTEVVVDRAEHRAKHGE